MSKYHNYTVTYFGIHGELQSAPITARSDVDAAAQAVSICDSLRFLASKSSNADLEGIGAFVALQVFADEREGRVIWTNALFDELLRLARTD